MNLEAGFQLIVFLVLFGAFNYVMMLNRFENEQIKNRNSQLKRIKSLYPKGTFISS